MIITRTPFRIPIGGGGTDLPSYYSRFKGFFLSAAVDKYTFITANWSFRKETHLRYSETEHVPLGEFDKIKHPIIREALRLTGIKGPIEITSMADILAGTGIGSSGSFTVGLLNTLHAYKREHISAKDLAEEACRINMELLKTGSGKQDEYIASYGGITCFEIDRDGNVTANPLKISPHTVYDLEERLLMFFTGFTRSSSELLKHQEKSTERNETKVIESLHKTKELGYEIKTALESGDTYKFAELMNTHWQNKKRRGQISNPLLDRCYDVALKNGALGGKLIGSGGGGFLIFYTQEQDKLRESMKKEGLEEIRFRFDFEGSKVIFNGEQYRQA